jgi:hypothetical protein
MPLKPLVDEAQTFNLTKRARFPTGVLMEKLCRSCNRKLDISKFNKNKSRKDGLQAHCRDCTQAKFKSYYSKNQDYHKKVVGRNTRRVKALRKAVIDIKRKIGKCYLCPETETACLQFHHIQANTKVREVSNLISANVSWKRIIAEIKKCILVCSNCHIKLHKNLIQLPSPFRIIDYYSRLLPDEMLGATPTEGTTYD